MSVELRIIDGETVRALAPPDKLIGWMRDAMLAVSRRDVELPLRRGMVLPDGLGAIGMMPGYVGSGTMSAGVKLVSLVPPERRRGSSHLGLMILYDAAGLVPEAILCGATVTALRTAAATALATDILARPDARHLAILGAGEQAEAHIAALRHVRPSERIVLWARRREQADLLARRLGVGITVADTIADATFGADVVCTVTAAREPFLTAAHISPGTHVNLVGSSAANASEATGDLVACGRYFVDFIPSALDQAGELLEAMRTHFVGKDHIAGEVGAILSGQTQGRRSPEEITIYKSLGIAAQDIVTARNVLLAARAAGLGMVIHL